MASLSATTIAFGATTGKSNNVTRRRRSTISTSTGAAAESRRVTAAIRTKAAAQNSYGSSSEITPVQGGEVETAEGAMMSAAAAASSRRSMVLGSLGTLGSVAMGAAMTTASVMVPSSPAWAADAAEGAANDAPAPAPADAPDAPRRTKKNVIITGSNSGIGYDAAAKLAAQGYSVTLACRTKDKALDAKRRIEEAAAQVGADISGDLIPAECNLADLTSVRRFAASWQGEQRHVSVMSHYIPVVRIVCIHAHSPTHAHGTHHAF